MVMPFGLTNAPATCHEVINGALREYLDISVIAYSDDILIYSDTIDNHVQHVKLVLDCLQRKNLLIKPEKYDFHKQKVLYLGFLIGRDGMSIDPEKLQAVKDWERLTNVKEVQFFLGFINYNGKFIEEYSKRALPLTNLIIEKNPWQWEEKEEAAFQNLKAAYCTQPVLKIFDPEKPIQIETDASDLAIGACFSQKYDKNWHPIAYLSRKLSAAEQNYDVHDKKF